MKEPSSEQLREIGRKATCAYMAVNNIEEGRIAAGRAAWDACLPIIAGEALREPQVGAIGAGEILGAMNTFNNASGRANTHEGIRQVLVWFCANRLAAMTAPSDPAEDAVMTTGLIGSHDREAAKRIVAAVDEARKK